MDGELMRGVNQSVPEANPLGSSAKVRQTGAVKAWRVSRYGRPAEVMALEDVPTPEPGPGEVRIRVSSITLNFNDLDAIYGRYQTIPLVPPFTPGMEVLGRVDLCGPNAEAWMGRRVVAVPGGAHSGYAEAVIAPTAMTFEMPADIPEPAAAAIFMPFHLAWLGLHERGRLQAGETLLVHAGAGGIGSAAVQLGAAAGARVVATAGSGRKLALCEELGAEVVVDYRRADFVDAVPTATDGRGVDVAFDTLGGAVTRSTFSCMAFNGRHLMVGFTSGIEAEDEGIVPRPIVFGNLSLCGVCLAYVDNPRDAKQASNGYNFPSHADGERIHTRLVDLVHQATVRPLVGLELPFASLPVGLEALQNRETVGRVVVGLSGGP
jgi:NADPH2:quinone reductase